MDFIKVLLLGIVEGITEFLPVSSTGHLILFHEFIKLEPATFQNAFDVCIQLGAILAVVVLYFHKLYPFSKIDEKGNPARPDKVQYTIGLWIKVVIGVLPSAVLGFLFDDFIDAHLFNSTIVAIMLVVWGIIILLVENFNQKRGRRPKFNDVGKIPVGIAFAIGLFQCLAMIPGTSRSAATIMGALLLGASRGAAAEFSFFLAIPTMMGATLLKIVKNGLVFSGYQWFLVFLGALVSFIVAIIVIKKFLGYVQKKDFKIFGYYRIVLGIILLIAFQFFL
ncbi:undecaprenyl-diphosphate phosphatase [Peptoniphilus sp. KCTC 25270]|uniref:undecaprenyl-diphosphate phosphatase n=1 Tax=Peptoniphilus sp. KCTC 25270 TaxID=2897414 RepID=UPI001E28E4A3|nr:undecaprenyl-diphosphate phosphatase [Peptoniphilus sp. KCTC 25270]MCD1147325.1 undecaprenyl-diphosphate phosphatase [Peptoniphilus sp. KCTC 25270]